ncbi:MAG: 16S rRNA (cytosine(1402)-N(4))-methyltransferase RsmH [Patescibacteria group bacterium]
MTHTPVLLKEVITVLDPKPGEFFIDGTVGGGGHTLEILKKIGPKGKLLGIDWDEEAIKNFKFSPCGESPEGRQISSFKNVILLNDSYANLPKILEAMPAGRQGNKLGMADGLLLDLGMSSDQLECSGRGFSFMRDEPLDMRYRVALTDANRAAEPASDQYESASLTAAEIISSFNEKELADIFFQYGDERFSRRIAQKIIEERKKQRILTTFGLVDVIKKAVPKNYERGRIHPATRVFQALRIYVNQELENLENLLKNIDKILKPKGRIAIISFHSLEDRLVKNYFREKAKEKKIEILTKKPISPTIEEAGQNPRSRSAKLRAAIVSH